MYCDDNELGKSIGHAWAAGLLYAIGFNGKQVEERDLNDLALEVINSVPGFAIDEEFPSDDLVEGVLEALDDARASGLIYLAGERASSPASHRDGANQNAEPQSVECAEDRHGDNK